MYFIHDFELKELIFGFETFRQAEIYYLIKNITEKLKLYKHILLTKAVDEIDNLFIIRDIDAILENIEYIDEETEENTISNQLILAKSLLNKSAISVNYKICQVPETIRTYKIK